MSEKEAIDRSVRHRILLEKYSNSEVKKAQAILKEVEEDLIARLSKEGVTINNTKRYQALLKDVKALLKVKYGKIGETLIADMEKLAPIEAEFEYKSLKTGFDAKVQTVLPTAAQLHAAVFSKPLEGEFLKPYVKNWTKTETKRITNALTQGFYRGTTTDEISRQIRGTRKNKYKDGIIGGTTNRNATALVRTAITHTSSRARMATMMANDDIVIGWKFINVLDSRTSPQCYSQDPAIVHPLGRGPIPPLHLNCRSTMVYVPNPKFGIKPTKGITTRASVGASGPKPVPATQTYSTWMRNQPAAFQDKALGKTKGALFRRGGLPLEKFTTDANDVLTLKELRNSYPLAFEKANIK